MKHPFFKSVLVLAAAAALINCSEENTTAPENDQVVSGQLVASDYCWVLNTDQTLLILATGVVTDVNGNAVGYTDPTFTNIVTLDGTQFIVTNIDLNNLTMLNPGDPIPSNNSLIPGSSATVAVPSSSATIATPASSATATKPTSSAAKPASSANNPTAMSSSSVVNQQNNNQNQTQSNQNNQQTQGGSDGTCFDKPSNKYVKPYENLNVNGASYAYSGDCSLNCYYDPQGKNCASLGSSTNNNNNQQQTQNNNQQQSSSSKPKSSSSTPKSSSSQAQQNNNNNSGTVSSNYTIKYVSGGKSGSGWATRYWDCCKPHCAWPDKGGLKAHACDARGNRINDDGAKSMCDGGDAGICRGQFPIVVNDNLAFAFAAVPGSAGAQCGKCYDLAFTGKGKYATDNHKALAGKHLIVIASNIGYDVADGQFDIMIPGGGVGIFNGCSAKMGWGSQGAQYGGLLTECEESSGYKATTYKSCLTNKCNTSFANDPEAKQGCLFLANWMNAAGNPLHEYKEVECPKELLDRF